MFFGQIYLNEVRFEDILIPYYLVFRVVHAYGIRVRGKSAGGCNFDGEPGVSEEL